MAKIAAATLLGAVAATDLAVTWSDCGDASTHGKISDVEPKTLTLGQTTTITGTGNVDEQITAGTFTIAVTAGGIKVLTWDGDLCSASTKTLPLGLGEIDFKGMSCPVAAGAESLGMDVKLSSSIPVSMATADVTVNAAATSGDKLLCMNVHVQKAESATASCSGGDDFPTTPACYEANVLSKEDVVVQIESYSAGAGRLSFSGTGATPLSCETAFAKDSSNKITFDNCDVSSFATVKDAQYCSDTDALQVTFNPLGVPIPVSVQLAKVDCASAVKSTVSCSGTEDFPLTPSCYEATVLGKEDVKVQIESYAAGAGRLSFAGSGAAPLSCETAFSKDSSNKIAFENCDVSSFATVKDAQYCSDTDALKVTFLPLGVAIPVSVQLAKVDCGSDISV